MQDDRALELYQEDDEDHEINIRDYLNIIKKRLPIILTITVIVFSWQVLKTFTAIPLYTASSDVLIEKNRGNRNLDFQYSGYDPYFHQTQTEIIKSEEVARQIVGNLQLDKRYKKYFIEDEPQEKSFISELVKTVRESIEFLLPKGEENELAEEKLSDADIITDIVGEAIDVVPVPETKIVTVTFEHKNPAIAKLVANAAVQAYKDVTLDIKLSATNYELQWMNEKAGEERRKLEQAETALQKYKRDNDLVTVENRLTVIPQKLNQINQEFTRAQTERRELEEVYQQIMDAGDDMSQLQRIPVFADNQVLQTIREKIFRAKQNIEELSKKYGYKHPRMINAKDELKILQNEMKFEVDRTIASTRNSYKLAQKKERNLKDLLTETKTELLNVNEKFVQLSIMQREVDTNRVLYDALTSSIKKTGVTEQAQSVNIWMVRRAEIPEFPSSPNTKRALALGLILGLALGGGMAFFLEYLDNTVKSDKDLSSRFDLTVLGTIKQLKKKKEEIESFIVHQPLSPLAESYRLIRSNLLLSSAEKPPQTVLVTSMGEQEGKTSTTINIARVLSQDGKKVVIIDCDLRKPRVHKVFGMKNSDGLSSYLTGNLESNLLHNIPGENIKVITSGPIPPNPAELLNSQKMRTLIEKMAGMFDFILIDSPPVQRVTDSLVVSQVVDGTIVVVKAGKTTNEMLASGMKKLRDVNAHCLGFVLNGMKEGDAGGGYYSGYNTYYARDE